MNCSRRRSKAHRFHLSRNVIRSLVKDGHIHVDQKAIDGIVAVSQKNVEHGDVSMEDMRLGIQLPMSYEAVSFASIRERRVNTPCIACLRAATN